MVGVHRVSGGCLYGAWIVLSSCWVRTGRVRTGRVRTARVRTGRVRTARVRTGLVRTGKYGQVM